MKKNRNKQFITVVTVVKNGQAVIEDTIKSVINQKYDNYEYVVIDGNSTDGTSEIIGKYNKYIDLYIRENNSGVYDAMNKSIWQAQGEYINFLNAGDVFYNNNILREVADILDKRHPDLFHGRQEYFKPWNGDSVMMGRELTFGDVKRGKTIAHQSAFSKVGLLKELNGFDVRYKIAADYDLLFRIFKAKKDIYFFDGVICRFLAGGLSSNYWLAYWESLSIIKRQSNLFYYFYYFFIAGFRLFVYPVIKRVLGPVKRFIFRNIDLNVTKKVN